jgi:hypothetical protein
MTIQQTFIGLQIKEPTMLSKTLLTLPLLLTLASPVLADADKALLAKCDLDRNGVINGPANDLPPAAWAMVEKERVCEREYELDQLAKAVPDIRKRCDLNGNGRIDHPEPLTTPILMAGTETNGRQAWRSLPEAVRKQVDVEQKCVTDAELAKDKAELAKDKAELAKDKAELAKDKAELARLDAEGKRFNQIMAMLPKEDVKRSLNQQQTQTEQELRSTTSPEQREKLRIRLRIIQEELAKLK